jgi:hypothetical protein
VWAEYASLSCEFMSLCTLCKKEVDPLNPKEPFLIEEGADPRRVLFCHRACLEDLVRDHPTCVHVESTIVISHQPPPAPPTALPKFFFTLNHDDDSLQPSRICIL